MNTPDRTRLDELLDLLADEVAVRLKASGHADHGVQAPSPGPTGLPAAPSAGMAPVDEPSLQPVSLAPADEPSPPPAGPPHAARLMARLALLILVLAVLINIPFNRHGTTLATALPDSASLMIRNGLLVKEAGKSEIYVYQDGRFRWISSLDAFEHYGFKWDNVRIVEDGFLAEFEIGTPLHALLKCEGSPHIFRAEEGVKRWIIDIPTFEAEGHTWSDVRIVPCTHLREIPDGETIPPGHGPPPQP